MEKPNLNNQPKVGIEKMPQENQGSFDAQEYGSGKRENITLEIDGQTIEVVKYYFEYPERIQKETGILGYTRVKIPKESIKNCKKEEFLKDVLENLSNGEYPNQTFNHRLGADMPREQTKKYHEYLRDDKFFLQKIFDVDRLSKSFKEIELGIPTKDRFKYYRKSDNDFINASGKIGSTSLIENLKTNQNKSEIYAIGPEGLNTKYGFMWGEDDDSGHGYDSLATFGFSSGDHFYYNYIIKSLELYKELYKKDPTTYLHPITNIIAQIIIQDKHLSNLYEARDENHKYSLSKETLKKADLDLRQYAEEKINKLLEQFQLDFITDENVDKYVREKYGNPESYKKDMITHIIGEIGEPDIPIIINHDEIPQLSWGYAKYAHYFNDRSFNFLKFKHAESLPTKEDIGSSES